MLRRCWNYVKIMRALPLVAWRSQKNKKLLNESGRSVKDIQTKKMKYHAWHRSEALDSVPQTVLGYYEWNVILKLKEILCDASHWSELWDRVQLTFLVCYGQRVILKPFMKMREALGTKVKSETGSSLHFSGVPEKGIIWRASASEKSPTSPGPSHILSRAPHYAEQLMS